MGPSIAQSTEGVAHLRRCISGLVCHMAELTQANRKIGSSRKWRQVIYGRTEMPHRTVRNISEQRICRQVRACRAGHR